jgi:hypothetical protein
MILLTGRRCSSHSLWFSLRYEATHIEIVLYPHRIYPSRFLGSISEKLKRERDSEVGTKRDIYANKKLLGWLGQGEWAK